MTFNPNLEENKTLFTSARGGSAAFIQELLKQQTSDMYFLARVYLHDIDAAKQTVRNAFSTAYSRFLAEVTEIEKFEPWLMDIVRSEAIKCVQPIQGETADARYTRADEKPAVNMRYPEDEKTCRKYILQVLDVLNKDERAACAARYYEHMETEQAADLLGVTEGDVEDLLVNAKEKLEQVKVQPSQLIALINHVHPGDNVIHSPLEDIVVVLPEDKQEKEKRERAASIEISPDSTSRRTRDEDDDDEDEDDYDDDEGYADYDYDRHGRRKRHKRHLGLKILLVILIILALCGGALYGVFRLDRNMFYTIPGTTRLVQVLEVITGKDIPGPDFVSAEATPTPTATAVPTATPVTEGLIAGTDTGTDTVIGQAVIQLESINIRSDHSTDGEIVGAVYSGETYDVYGVYKASDFTWYRIGEGMWVADDGTYLQYTALQ